jgi:hypothetical protein
LHLDRHVEQANEPADDERDLRGALQRAAHGWRSRRGPDLLDLLRRADRSWQRPIVILSTAGAAVLALLLLAAVMLVVTAPPTPAAEVVRDHLLAH